MRYEVPKRRCGWRNQWGRIPSSETRFSTPFEPTMAVLTAPASIKTPTTTTKTRNTSRSDKGPTRYIASPPIGLSKKLLRTESGIIITAKNATPAVKIRLYRKMTNPAFSRFRSLGCSISR